MEAVPQVVSIVQAEVPEASQEEAAAVAEAVDPAEVEVTVIIAVHPIIIIVGTMEFLDSAEQALRGS